MVLGGQAHTVYSDWEQLNLSCIPSTHSHSVPSPFFQFAIVDFLKMFVCFVNCLNEEWKETPPREKRTVPKHNGGPPTVAHFFSSHKPTIVYGYRFGPGKHRLSPLCFGAHVKALNKLFLCAMQPHVCWFCFFHSIKPCSLILGSEPWHTCNG